MEGEKEPCANVSYNVIEDISVPMGGAPFTFRSACKTHGWTWPKGQFVGINTICPIGATERIEALEAKLAEEKEPL